MLLKVSAYLRKRKLMSLGKAVFFIILLCPILLFGNTITINGTFYKGAIDRYCVKPLQDTSFEMELTSSRTNCLTFLDSSGELGKRCRKTSYLYVSNLQKDTTYYVIETRLKTSTITTNYELWINATNEIEVGVCPADALARAAGMSGEQMSFMLSLSGLAIAVMFFGSITHIILMIKEW